MTVDLSPPDVVRIAARGAAVLHDPLTNKDGAFSPAERDELELHGLLPAAVTDLESQVHKAKASIEAKGDDLEKYIGLVALQDRNETIFYRLLQDNIERYLPIVYTPTVGLATQRYSEILRRPRGIWVNRHQRGRIAEVLRNAPVDEVRLIVATDGERILGLGDLGAGGMGISIGKLALYSVGAGIHPGRTLAICLDVGTDNQELLENPQYVGLREARLRGDEYDQLVDEFVHAVRTVFPRALLQWEDFKKNNAMTLLSRYRQKLLSFNDDIQGTAAVGLAGVLAGVRATGIGLDQHRFLIVGAGAAGAGIAQQIRSALLRSGLSAADAATRIGLLDSRGLLVAGRTYRDTDRYKLDFSWPTETVLQLGLEDGEGNQLETVVEAFQPSVLIGTSGQSGAFTEAAVRAMARTVDRPLIFPFSNPTASSEGDPSELIDWTEGRAYIATGSPFPSVQYDGRTIQIGQGNNVYVFPGVGLGALVSGAREITDQMFTVAAQTLAERVSDDELSEGRLYPHLGRLREVSRAIARAVAREAMASGLAPQTTDEELTESLARSSWEPSYPRIEAV